MYFQEIEWYLNGVVQINKKRNRITGNKNHALCNYVLISMLCA